MYEQHFGLAEQPFGLTPNTSYFLNAQGYREAFNLLQIALANGEGFIKVVGEVGTGKTMLCRKLLNTLGADYYTAYIPNPSLDPEALYRAVIDELDINAASKQLQVDENDQQDSESAEDINSAALSFVDRVYNSDPEPPQNLHEAQKIINSKLVSLTAMGKKVVLVVDEAQSMSVETLEALRLISNLETESSKLVHIVLFGQPELDKLLAQKNLRQLRQRISFSCRLTAMSLEVTRSYVQHRVATAGYDRGTLFDDRAVKLLSRASRGIPRLINILCHKALMSAYGRGDMQIDKTHMRAAIKDTEGVEMPMPLLWLWRFSLFAVVNVTLLGLIAGNEVML